MFVKRIIKVGGNENSVTYHYFRNLMDATLYDPMVMNKTSNGLYVLDTDKKNTVIRFNRFGAISISSDWIFNNTRYSVLILEISKTLSPKKDNFFIIKKHNVTANDSRIFTVVEATDTEEEAKTRLNSHFLGLKSDLVNEEEVKKLYEISEATFTIRSK